MITIFDYVKAEEIAAYITEQTSNKIPYIGESLFPTQKTFGTDISWIKGADGLPVAITPSEYDVKASLREREKFGKLSSEMAFFREAMRIGEKDRQQMNNLMYAPSAEVALPIIKNIFDDIKRLTDGVEAQAEYMRMKLLVNGSFEVANKDATCSYKYDYNMKASNKVTVSVPWSAYATSDPISDIRALCDSIEDATGVRPTKGLLNRKTFLDMIASESIKKELMIGVTGSYTNLRLSDEEALNYVETKTGVKFQVYAKKIGVLDGNLRFNTDSSTFVNLIDDDKVVLFPDGKLGTMWKGTTPEESDLLTGASQAKCSIINGGTAITTYKEPHPVNVLTIVSAVMAPSFEAIDNVGVLTTATVSA